MGIFSRMMEKARQQIGALVFGGRTGSFSHINSTLASNETIFSAISMLAGAIASAPISLRENYERVSQGDHSLAYLLEFGMNPNMTTFYFIRLMETLRNTTGAGYALKELDANGQVAAIWALKTENVQPIIEKNTDELYYRVKDADGEAIIHNSLILDVGHISTDGVKPINPIDVLQASLDYDRRVKEFSVNQMENELRASFLIRTRSLGDEQIKELNETIARFKKNGVIYLSQAMELVELKGKSIIDPKVFEAENITIARVARVYNIPLEKFLPDKSSYSSAEQSDLNYLRDTILPMARMYEQEFSRKLLTDAERARGMRIKFSLNGFARADMQTRGDFYMKGIRSGWFSPDDIRELEDMPPLPAGKGQSYYTSRDLVEIGIGTDDLGGLSVEVPEEIAKISLNGAQIAGILQVIEAMNSGTMEYESALTLLIAAFPFDRAQAMEILGEQKQTGGTE